jgi:hypothetical protein
VLPALPIVKRGFFALALWGTLALAQADLPDAGLPDASVGGTGAERASEEEDSQAQLSCLSDRDCDRGFQCVKSKCSHRRFRDATYEGCSATSSRTLVWMLAAVVMARKVGRRGAGFTSW